MNCTSHPIKKENITAIYCSIQLVKNTELPKLPLNDSLVTSSYK